jgi:hypothetical protein
MSLDLIPLCDVFYPTQLEFSNFQKYAEQCEKDCKTGIMKVKFINF